MSPQLQFTPDWQDPRWRLPQALIFVGFSETQHFGSQNWLLSQACPRFIQEMLLKAGVWQGLFEGNVVEANSGDGLHVRNGSTPEVPPT